MALIEEILELSTIDKLDCERQIVGTTAIRTAMKVLPELPPGLGYNAGVEFIESYFIDDLKLIKGIHFQDEHVELVIDILENIQRANAGLKKKSFSDFHWDDKRKILQSQNNRCLVCGIGLTYPADPSCLSQPELDHIIPFVFAGNHPSNLQVICKACNIGKHQHIAPYTDAQVSMNLFYMGEMSKRLRYWVYVRYGCKCSVCGSSARTTKLEIGKRHSRGRVIFDNLISCCKECAVKSQIELIERDWN